MLLALHAPIPDPVAKQAIPPHSLLVKMNLCIQVQDVIIIFFLMWSSFKVFIQFVKILFVLCFGFLAARHVGSWLCDQG